MNKNKNKISVLLITMLISVITNSHNAIADSSTNFKVSESSLNTGGGFNSSSSFGVHDTLTGSLDGVEGSLQSSNFTVQTGTANLAAYCGNEIVEVGEWCDDGWHCQDGTDCAEHSDCAGIGDNLCRTRGNDGCSEDCRLENICGNGVIEGTEECDTNAFGGLSCTDYGFDTGTLTCSSACVIETTLCSSTAVCGNGIIEPGEECEAGDLNGETCRSQGYDAGDLQCSGCSFDISDCYNTGGGPTYVCGDGDREGPEECDDGNNEDGDGCSATCDREDPVCGNGNVEDGEQCDDGNTEDGDGCSATCQDEDVVCGDGDVEGDEECDDGNTEDGDGCSAICEIEEEPICGDGNMEGDEECDDGNNEDGDGCSATCELEEDIVTIIAYPQKRVPSTGNFSTTATIKFYSAGSGSLVHTATVDTNDSGYGELDRSEIPVGNYHISLKGRSHLTHFIRNIDFQETVETLEFTDGGSHYLLAGDANPSKDDFVNGLDLSKISVDLYSAGLDSDMNYDGLVNGLDLSITSTNLYLSGEVL